MSRAPSMPGRPSGWPADPDQTNKLGAARSRSSNPPPPASQQPASQPPRKSISPWANPASLPSYAVGRSASMAAREAREARATQGHVSEVVAVPRASSTPSNALSLPMPPEVQTERRSRVREEDRSHHWSDPPPRSDPPRSAPSPAPHTPYFTVPPAIAAAAPPVIASAAVVAPVVAAAAGVAPVVAAAVAAPVAAVAAAELAPHPVTRPLTKSVPSGAEAGRTSDPGDFSDHAQFFASKPPQRNSMSEALWDDDPEPSVHTMTHGSKRAMLTTFGILGVSVAIIGAFVIYNTVVMPAPAPLTGAVALDLPTPGAAPTATPQAAAPQAAAPSPAPTPAPKPVAPTTPVEAPVVATPEAVVDDAEPIEQPENEPFEQAPTEETVKQYQALIAQAGMRSNRSRAVELYEQAIALDPNGDLALSKLAFHYLNLGKNEAAREYAQRAVAANPKSSEGWIVLGAAREALRDREGAAEAYKQCAEIGEGEYVAECKRVAPR